MVQGERPAQIVADKLLVGVQRGYYFVDSRRVDLDASTSVVLPLGGYNYTEAEDMMIALTSYTATPFTPPLSEPGVADPKLAR